MKQSINSRWVTEKGRWDESRSDFLDREQDERFKYLKMKIIDNNCLKDDLIKFDGGPTGYESYYVQSLYDSLMDRELDDNSELCICGGTINIWSACYVNAKEVLNFIKLYLKL